MSNEKFILERSSNGYNWEAIDNLPGAGNSTVRIDYTAWDESPMTGSNYYRIRQVGFDGTESF